MELNAFLPNYLLLKIQARQYSFLYKARRRLQVHLEETVGSCVLLSVFTGLLLLATERQDARTGQEIFFFLCMRIFDKNISCTEASENMQSFNKILFSVLAQTFFPKGFLIIKIVKMNKTY